MVWRGVVGCVVRIKANNSIDGHTDDLNYLLLSRYILLSSFILYNI